MGRNRLDSIHVGKPSRPSILEATRQKKIINYLNAIPNCQAESRTQTGYGKKGGADVFGCHNGRHFELEVKQPKKEPSKLQKEWLRRWAETGAITGRVEDVESTRIVFKSHGVEI